MNEFTVSFELNGASVETVTAAATPASEVLREQLNTRSVKVGCGAGDCGACTVMIDGQQACACLVPAAQLSGASVVTAETDNPTVALLRAAFLKHGAAQCGICTPGMLMAACSFIEEGGQAQRQAVEDALAGVLCRCTGYSKIIDAVMAVAAAEPCIAEEAQAGAAVGARVVRVDGIEKVSGTARFGADEVPADALWLRAIRSPYARASFVLGDLQAWCDNQDGIERVFTAVDVPGVNGHGVYPDLKDQPVFAEMEACYRGQAVLALLGDRDAVEAIDPAQLPIEWTELAAIKNPADALSGAFPPVQARFPDHVLARGYLERGLRPAEDQIAAAVQGVMQTSAVEHAYIEPEAGYAQREGDCITVFGCTQAPYMDRDDVAGVLALPLENVRIIPSACGGGFGGKLDVSFQVLLAVAAWQTGKPVRVVFSRAESMAASTKRHPATIAASASVAPSGELLSMELQADFDTGAFSSWGPTVAGRVPVHASGPYRVPRVKVATQAVLTNNPPSGAFRGFGTPQAAALRELMLDQLADQLDLDRLEFRHQNALREGDTSACGHPLLASVGMQSCLDSLREAWQESLARAATFNETAGDWRRGVGVAGMWYGCGNTAMSNPSSIRVKLFANGRLVLYNGAVDIGQGSATVMRQICADALGVALTRFEQIDGDTALTDDAGKSSASRQTFVSGKATQLAGEDLRAQLLNRHAAPESAKIMLGDEALEIYVDDELLVRELFDGDDDALLFEGHGTYDPPTTPLDENGQGVPYATYAFAAQVCELRVDTATGKVIVDTVHAAHDLGRTINPTMAEGQIEGGIAQGLGMALMEEYLPGWTENLHDYLIPTVGDMPVVNIQLIESPEPEGPYGAKGLGEPALVPTPAAILCAIRHATGVIPDRLPVLPYRLLEAIDAKKLRDNQGEQA